MFSLSVFLDLYAPLKRRSVGAIFVVEGSHRPAAAPPPLKQRRRAVDVGSDAYKTHIKEVGTGASRFFL